MSFMQVRVYANLCRDIELRFLPSNTPVATFGVASNRRWKDAQGQQREEVTFADVTAFGPTANLLNEKFKKGDPILFDGRLKYESWDDKQDGKKRSKLSIVCEQVHFLPRRDSADGDSQEPRSTYASQTRKAAPPPSNPVSEESQFKEDDIPF